MSAALRLRVRTRLLFVPFAFLAIGSTRTYAAVKPDNANDAVEVKTLSAQASVHEQYDRDVDRAALSAQESSIEHLKSLLRRYAGTRQEPVLLSKLAELQKQKAGIQFRIAHGAASRKTKPGLAAPALDLAQYHKTLEASVSTLNLLIAKYPHFEEIAHAYYSRGKAFEEMEKKPESMRDYDFLVSHFPDAEETSPAYMALADFAIEANNHPKAIGYLKEIEKRPEDTHYPFALYKLAWSYYNLKNVPAALGYAEKQIAWYNEHAPVDKAIESSDLSMNNVMGSDNALRENTLLDVPVFYFDATEAKDDRYPADKALAYFRKLNEGPKKSNDHAESGSIFGKMAVRFAKLLRTRNMEPELIAWKDQFLKEEPKRPEGLDIVIVTYEFLQNRRDYVKLEAAAGDIVKLKQSGLKFENLGKAQKMILDTAESLQALIIQNKQTQEAHPLSHTLAHLYAAFTQVVEDGDPRVPQVHYNLAETLFAIQDYEGATENYRWVVEHLQTKNKEVLASVADAGVKAIAARYEILLQKHLVGQEIKAQALPVSDLKTSKPSHDEKIRSNMDPLLETWIAWIDAEPEKRSNKAFDNFLFEANRSLYARGNIEEATERLGKFARQHPESEYAIPSASLVIDTALASHDWDRSLELSKSFGQLFSKTPNWKGSVFSKRLAAVAADSKYKKIELAYAQKSDAKESDKAEREEKEKDRRVLDDVDSFLKEYPTSERVGDALTLAGAASIAAGDHERAIGYFSRLITAGKNDAKNPASAERVTQATLARAAIEEDEYVFIAAAMDYRSLLEDDAALLKKMDSGKVEAMRRKAVALAYLSGDAAQFKATLASRAICTEAMAGECEKYRALAMIQAAAESPLSEEETEKVFDRFRKMPPSEVRTILAAYTLLGAKHLAFRDRNLTLRTIGSAYKDLDAMTKFALMPLLSREVEKTFELNRLAMKDVAPLRADERYITHRVDMIREMENAATQSMELPWARIRASILNETAYLYSDIAHGLEALSPPKNMTEAETQSYNETVRKLSVPFEEKGQDIRNKAFTIASQAAIEDVTLKAIADPFFAENPSQAKKLKADATAARPAVLYPPHLAFVPLGMGYAPIIEKDEKLSAPAKNLYAHWLRAVREQKWAQVSYFLQQARERKLFTDPELSLLKGVSLAQAGARGEGLSELEDSRKNFPSELKPIATLTLARSFEDSFSASRSKPFYSELLPPAPVSKPKP